LSKLGDILKAEEQKTEDENKRREQEHIRYLQQEAKAGGVKVQSYFDGLRPLITRHIKEHRKVPYVSINRSSDADNKIGTLIGAHNLGGAAIEKDDHIYHYIWRDFQRWAEEEGLRVYWGSDDDGKQNVDGYCLNSWPVMYIRIHE